MNRCGVEVRCKEVGGIVGVAAAGTTEHLPSTYPQLPTPQSSGPSQDAVHGKLHSGSETWFTQLVGWQQRAGTQSLADVQVRLSTGFTDGTVVAEVMGVVSFDDGGGPAVHPARNTAVMQMTKNTGGFLFIQRNFHGIRLLNSRHHYRIFPEKVNRNTELEVVVADVLMISHSTFVHT